LLNARKTEESLMPDAPQSSARGVARAAFAALARLPTEVRLTIEAWRERSRLRRLLGHLRRHGELERVLTDCGIAPTDVWRLMRAHASTPKQLAAMMQRLGIDRAALQRGMAVSEEMRAMEWRCGECADWRTCHIWLAVPDGPGSYRAFCPNAEALDRLRDGAAAPSDASVGQPGGIQVELAAAKGVDGARD
jgi:hypothetical protein